jgi:uncharacterized membrane protein (UPF0127 family)
MRSKLVAVAAAVVLLFSCEEDGEPAASDRPDFPRGTVLIETDDGSKLLEVEVAETDEQRRYGLMFRESLDEDSGMVFIFFEPQTGGFWMKNTLIPLSIAYFDVDGEILRILDMKPCKKDPCPSYFPGIEYMGALEVNRGAFEEWGVEEGDVIHVRR